MNCLECNAPSACYRYKCCGLNFCSVPCYNVHSCTAKTTTDVELAEKARCKDAYTQDGRNALLSHAQVEALKGDKHLRRMLSNNVLRRVLRGISSASDPVAVLTPYLQDDFFSDFVTQVLNTLSAVEEPESGRHSN